MANIVNITSRFLDERDVVRLIRVFRCARPSGDLNHCTHPGEPFKWVHRGLFTLDRFEKLCLCLTDVVLGVFLLPIGATSLRHEADPCGEGEAG